MDRGTFDKVDASSEVMYGPKGVVVCGYGAGEHEPLIGFLQRVCGEDLRVVFAGDGAAGDSLHDLLARPHRCGEGDPSTLRRALVLSGLTQKELHTLMGAYRRSGLPKQLWAVLTPTSETWALGDLLEELARESEALQRSRRRAGKRRRK